MIASDVSALHLNTGDLDVEHCQVEVDRFLGVEPRQAESELHLTEHRIPVGDIPVDITFAAAASGERPAPAS